MPFFLGVSLRESFSSEKKKLIIFIFAGVYFLLFVYGLITQILIHSTNILGGDVDHKLAVFPLVEHGIYLLIICIITIFFIVSFVQIFNENVPPHMRKRIKILLIFECVFSVVFLVKFLLEFFHVVLYNQIHDTMTVRFYEPCRNEKDGCLALNVYSFFIAILSDVVPSIILYCVYRVVNTKLKKKSTASLDPIDMDVDVASEGDGESDGGGSTVPDRPLLMHGIKYYLEHDTYKTYDDGSFSPGFTGGSTVKASPYSGSSGAGGGVV